VFGPAPLGPHPHVQLPPHLQGLNVGIAVAIPVPTEGGGNVNAGDQDVIVLD
jgi:hypothetical protein